MVSFDSSFLLSLFGHLSFHFLLDLLSLLHVHLLRLFLIESHILQKFLGLLLLPPLLSHLLALLSLGLVLFLHGFEIVVIALLDRFVVLARHQQLLLFWEGGIDRKLRVVRGSVYVLEGDLDFWVLGLEGAGQDGSFLVILEDYLIDFFLHLFP